MALDAPTTALLACVGCGCAGGGLCAYAPEEALPGPLADVKMAIVQVAENFGFGGSDYSYGDGRWDSRAGTWR